MRPSSDQILTRTVRSDRTRARTSVSRTARARRSPFRMSSDSTGATVVLLATAMSRASSTAARVESFRATQTTLTQMARRAARPVAAKTATAEPTDADLGLSLGRMCCRFHRVSDWRGSRSGWFPGHGRDYVGSLALGPTGKLQPVHDRWSRPRKGPGRS